MTLVLDQENDSSDSAQLRNMKEIIGKGLGL